MAYASITYTSASGTTFALTNSSGDPIPYLRQNDISVTVNGILKTLTTDYTFNGAGTAIVLNTSVTNATVAINRVTDISDATVVYTAGSTLTAQDLNNADNQIRYGLQEFSDTYGALTTGTGDLSTLDGFIGSNEIWVSDNAHAATTGAIDARVDTKIDTALTTDVVAGDSITVTDNSPGSGQITIGVTNASISTAKLVDSSVTTAKIADGNVTTAKILDANVTTAKILDSNVTTTKIADNAVTSAKIADGTIVASDLANDSVTTAKIVDSNVTTGKIADTAVTTGKLADSSVTAVKIADGVITSAKLNVATVVTAAEQAASTPDDVTFFTTSASDGRYVNVTGDTMSGALSMGSNKITSLSTPTASGDAANKSYVDGLVAAATLADADYGDITVSGSATIWTIDNGVVSSAKLSSNLNVDLASGSAATPSLTFDANTGLYSPGEDQVAVATNGSARLYIASDGKVGIGTTSPSVPLEVNGNARVSNLSVPDTNFIGFGSYTAYLSGSSASNFINFSTGSTERVRIDSSGRLLVGTSSARGNFFNTTGQEPAFQVEGTTNQTARISVTRCSNDDAASLLIFGKSRSASVGGNTIVAQNDFLGGISFQGADGSEMVQGAFIYAEVDGTPGANDMPGRLVFCTTADGASSPTERMRIGNEGNVYINKGSASFGTAGTVLYGGSAANGAIDLTRSAAYSIAINRLTSDGNLIEFYRDTVQQGTISVSGSTVSYNGAHLSRWTQLPSGAERTEILRGSVLSNLNEMCEWDEEDNEQLNRMKVSDVEGDKNVSGVFQAWDDDDDTYTNDFYCAMTGDFVIRIADGVSVERGDLLMSAGDGTAKPQDDDIIRSKTIAKVTSTNVSCTYDDGSYCVPCVLMAC